MLAKCKSNVSNHCRLYMSKLYIWCEIQIELDKTLVLLLLHIAWYFAVYVHRYLFVCLWFMKMLCFTYWIYRKDLTVHIAVVICGVRLQEGLTMIKSAVIFTFVKLHFYILAETQLHDPIHEKVNITRLFTVTFYALLSYVVNNNR